MNKWKGSVIKDIITSPIDEAKDHWRVDVLFKCNCGHEYKVGDADKDVMNDFLKSLEGGIPTKNISCPKCNPLN